MCGELWRAREARQRRRIQRTATFYAAVLHGARADGVLLVIGFVDRPACGRGGWCRFPRPRLRVTCNWNASGSASAELWNRACYSGPHERPETERQGTSTCRAAPGWCARRREGEGLPVIERAGAIGDEGPADGAQRGNGPGTVAHHRGSDRLLRRRPSTDRPRARERHQRTAVARCELACCR